MSSATHAMCTSSPSLPVEHAAGHRFARFARGLWRAYWARRARRASIMVLSNLDERTLQDIGLNRSEIESVVHDRSNQRLRSYDAGWE